MISRRGMKREGGGRGVGKKKDIWERKIRGDQLEYATE